MLSKFHSSTFIHPINQTAPLLTNNNVTNQTRPCDVCSYPAIRLSLWGGFKTPWPRQTWQHGIWQLDKVEQGIRLVRKQHFPQHHHRGTFSSGFECSKTAREGNVGGVPHHDLFWCPSVDFLQRSLVNTAISFCCLIQMQMDFIFISDISLRNAVHDNPYLIWLHDNGLVGPLHLKGTVS